MRCSSGWLLQRASTKLWPQRASSRCVITSSGSRPGALGGLTRPSTVAARVRICADV